ncbi:MAG: hypothetical protein WC052_02590 [Patescibacteria group bacterium]|jgi:hypothetical protein
MNKVFLALTFFLLLPSMAVAKQNENERFDASKPRALEQRLENHRRTLNDDVSKARLEVKDLREKQREELKEKVEGLRDARKKAAVERIAANLDRANEKAVERYGEALDRLDLVIAKIEKRISDLSAKGVVVTEVTTLLTAAKAKIVAARSALVTQSAKTYPLTITTEENLGVTVAAARQTLHSDLKVVQEAVVAARESLTSVLSALRLLTTETNE